MGASISSLTAKILVSEIKKEIEGKTFDKAQQVSEDTFKINFKSPKKTLMIQPGVRMHLTDYDYEAPQKASQIAMLLRKKLNNQKLINVFQHDADRVIALEFEDYYLITEFFSHGNFVLTDKNYKIIFTFRREEWKDRTFSIGETYKYPMNPTNPKENYAPVTKEDYERVSNMNAALDEHYAKQQAVPVKTKKFEKLEKRLGEQEKSLSEFEQKAVAEKGKADLIYANYQKISEIAGMFKEKKFEELKQKRVKIKEKNVVIELD